MEQEPTCGQGLVEHSVLPEKLAELNASVAEVLELHMKALILTDANSRVEQAAYLELVEEHRAIAARLMATARKMAGYRDLPMGSHDEAAMTGPRAREVFEQFVKVEDELLMLLQGRLEQDRGMLVEMGELTGQDP